MSSDIILGKFYSWEICSTNIAIKETDKSIFEHHGIGIPMQTRAFWNVENIKPGEKRSIELIYMGFSYDAYITCEGKGKVPNERTRLFWFSDLADFFIKKNKKENIVATNNYPLLRFKRVDNNTYEISFLSPDKIESETMLEDEADIIHTYSEGTRGQRYINKYKRSTRCRLEAIKYHGLDCNICGFNFEKVYGELGMGFIEIHHIVPLSELKAEKKLNPQTDLIPLCSNCHRMVHKQKEQEVAIDRVKRLWEYQKRLERELLR